MIKDRVVCLRTADYSETSQIVTLFAVKTGKIRAIAKGSKRAKSAFEGAIEIFSFGDVVFLPGAATKLSTLREFVKKPIFHQLRTKAYQLNCGLFAAELVDAFTEDFDAHESLFKYLISFLDDLQNCNSHSESLALLILFQLTLLNEIGAKPVLNECANCNSKFSQKWQGVYFSSSANGMVCSDCEQAFVEKVSLPHLCAASLGNLKLIRESSETTLKQIEDILIYHFTEQMHRPAKMAKYFSTKVGNI